jgi:hypothetical protein
MKGLVLTFLLLENYLFGPLWRTLLSSMLQEMLPALERDIQLFKT